MKYLPSYKTELISISKIKNNPNNPRVIRDEKFKKLVKSIREFPKMMEIRPIVVNSEMIVLGGNMRLRACKESGLSEVPIIRAQDLTEEQQREFIVKDNVGFGLWDWDEIANKWDQEELKDWGMDLPVFDLDNDQNQEQEETEKNESANESITFNLTKQQATQIKNSIIEAKKKEEFNFVETYGNENGNANAIYMIATQWLNGNK